MKNCVIDGAATTGRRIVRLALERGYQVTAVLRDPVMFEVSHGLLAVRSAPPNERDTRSAVLMRHDRWPWLRRFFGSPLP